MKDRLLHRPLYLRGFWDGDKIEFDSAGKPKQNLKTKPLTLSGIDVLSVSMDGRRLSLRAQRVALVADEETATAVSQAVYQPGTIAGEPVVADSTMRIRYDINPR